MVPVYFAEVLHYLDFSFSVLFLFQWLWVQKKLHIFLFTVSERGKSLPVFDPCSQPKELFSNGARFQQLLVLHELVHTIQQVCFFRFQYFLPVFLKHQNSYR